MFLVFRLLFIVTTCLSVAAAILVTASLFIADRAPHSAKFLAISLCFSGVFLGLGWLTFGIQNQVTAIAAIAKKHGWDREKDLVRRVGALVIYLVCGGTILCLILAFLVYAILARIDQGFAVFG